jgi:hypothetical protein
MTMVGDDYRALRWRLAGQLKQNRSRTVAALFHTRQFSSKSPVSSDSFL